MTTINTTRKCAECYRVFDLTNGVDAIEWSTGHDCEPAPEISGAAYAGNLPTADAFRHLLDDVTANLIAGREETLARVVNPFDGYDIYRGARGGWVRLINDDDGITVHTFDGHVLETTVTMGGNLDHDLIVALLETILNRFAGITA